MMSEWFSGLLTGIADFFRWLWSGISSFFVWLAKSCWNYVTDLFWSLYARVISWIASTFARVLPDSQGLDFDDRVDDIINLIAGWDQILPIHEITRAYNDQNKSVT